MNKIKIKLKWIILTCCIAIVAVLALLIGIDYCRMYTLPESHVEITGSVVDNSYNNYLSGMDLVRVGNRLYYNYRGSYASYGLYEISSDGAQRIHWEGYGPWAYLVGYWYNLFPIHEYEGKLLINTIGNGTRYVYNRDIADWELAQRCIQIYCENTQTFEEITLFGGTPEISMLNYQTTSFGFVYEAKEYGDLWVYTEEAGAEQITAEDVAAFYVIGDQIYYIVNNAPNNSYELRCFHWGKQVDTTVCELTDYSSMPYFIIEGDYLVFYAAHPMQNNQSIYKLDLRNPKQKEESIFSVYQEYTLFGGNIYSADTDDPASTYINSWNVWNGTVYVCTSKGLIACDLDTGELCALCDKNAHSCDIVDDTWVYFSEIDAEGYSSLWRVPQSGGDAELVFGK